MGKLWLKWLGGLLLGVCGSCGTFGVQLESLPGDHPTALSAHDAGSALQGADRDSGELLGDAASGCLDSDGDGVCDDVDLCPMDASKTSPGSCGCGVSAPPGLVAHWKLDETTGTVASDANGSKNGTLVNFSGSPWTAGQVDGGLAFDGVDDYVQVGNAQPSVKSLSFWLKPNTYAVTTDQTSWLSPSSTGPTNQWSNPTRAYAADGSEASVSTLLGSTKSQDWGGFHVSLPSGASVTGIEVAVKSSSFNLIGSFSIALSWNAGSSRTSGKSNFTLLGSTGMQAVGGQTDLWGRSSWSASELSDANFRVRATFGGILGTMNVDHVEVKVYYAPVAHPRKIMNVNDSTQLEFAGSGMALNVLNWTGAITYVNGMSGVDLAAGWNHVVITGPTTVDFSDLQFGSVSADSAAFPFDGVLDDVKIFQDTVSATDVETLYNKPGCGVP